MPEKAEKNKTVGGTLYLVATPIGNMADLSARACKVLSEVNFIAAEDTRNTLRLLTGLGIRNTLISYHEHNKRARGEEIAARLLAGESCALVTDAGMPAISDPGEDLVALCEGYHIPVTVVPGCCAAVSALALSGLPTRRFVFEGFLPSDHTERRARLSALAREERTTILYEAPHRLRATLSELYSALGNRRISICRELTKINEEISRTSLRDACAYYAEKEPRGEYVLVLDGGTATEDEAEENATASLSPEEAVARYCAEGMPRMEAIKRAARERGMSKSELYRILCHTES